MTNANNANTANNDNNDNNDNNNVFTELYQGPDIDTVIRVAAAAAEVAYLARRAGDCDECRKEFWAALAQLQLVC